MSACFYCNICDKSIKVRSKKKPLNSQYHKSSIKSIISRYSVLNPNFIHIEDFLKDYVDDYNKLFEFYLIFCSWKLHFWDNIINVKSDRLYIINRGWNLRKILISKIESFESYGYKFSHISEMNITFRTGFTIMTYEHYLKQPKPMVEWILNKKLAQNPELIKRTRKQLPSIN